MKEIKLKKPKNSEELVISIAPAASNTLSNKVDVIVEYRSKKTGKVLFAVMLYSE